MIRVIGALVPMPTERYYHPFGLSDYSVTYSGYQVLKNALQWQKKFPDLTLAPGDLTFTGTNQVTIRATVHNTGEAPASNVVVRFTDNGAQIGAPQTIASIPAGGTATVSVVWSTKSLKGKQTIAVTVDPADLVAESNEANNTATRTVTVKGGKVS